MSISQSVLKVVEPWVFARRRIGLVLLTMFTAFMCFQIGWKAYHHGIIDAGFHKQLPSDHPYIDTFKRFEETFRGANLISIALMQEEPEKEIYNKDFLLALQGAHDDVFFINGVNRAGVTSLFSPGVRYLEVVEGGFDTDDVISNESKPSSKPELRLQYSPSPAELAKIKANVLKAQLVGRLVADGHNGAFIRAELLEFDPTTGEKLDHIEVAKQLEKLRETYEKDGITVHIIGFPSIVGNVANAFVEVVVFFGITLIATMLLLWVYCGSLKLSFLPLFCSIVAVIWEFGLLFMLGKGLDPFAILVPFLVLANGVEHGIQMVNAWMDDMIENGGKSYEAAETTFRRLAIPGTAALITDIIGFATIALIPIPVIQEMALNAALGMAAIVITNKWLMPMLLTYTTIRDIEKTREQLGWRQEIGDKVWRVLAKMTQRTWATVGILIGVLLLAWSLWKGQDLRIGDFHAGVPELREDSRYNKDAFKISANFGLGVDVLMVMAEVPPEGCIEHKRVETIDRFTWRMENTPGVQLVISAPQVGKMLWTALNEGNLKWQHLPSHSLALAGSVAKIPTTTMLRNPDCSVMPVLIFTEDHKAETIISIIDAAKGFIAEEGNDSVKFHLASGNVGVMAATNEVVAERETPILLCVYAAVTLMCFLSFRSLSGVICVVLPLALVSFMAYAVMAVLEIGLKVATLPVVGLAVGIGIDFGIYSYSVLNEHIKNGDSLYDAWFKTLQSTGKAVVFTGVALSISVVTWFWSSLQFQADMGKLLVFMFLANMLGAIFLLPALGHFLIKTHEKDKG